MTSVSRNKRKLSARSVVAVAGAVLVVAGGGVSFAAAQGSTAPKQVPALTSLTPATPATDPRTVRPGEKVEPGLGHTMWLNRQGMVLATPSVSGGSETRLTKASEVPGGTISATASADRSGTLWAGVYRGPGTPAKVTVEIDGRTLTGKVVTLAGKPGWAAFYAVDPRTGSTAPEITVEAADGTVLARMVKKTS
ncbi:hypothetical protein ACF07V_31530 [Streptomyces sp. NPDC015661]|uniref:hypothetical protein n=1 Tax=Streptomyces sp. NPDC015661 TaxID=3364961 RepID=UPI0036FD6B82